MGGADEDAPLTGGSLCSGSGGLDLGLERALGVDWRWHCEKDDAASKILAARWPGVPNHGDLFDTDWSQVERVDLVAAGFPCPDYSLAGKRAGIDGEHGQVWLAVAAAVRALRPRYLVLENVDSIRSAAGPLDGAPGESAVGVVLADLADLGYRWAYDRLGASDVGAPHRRLRWFLVARLAAADAVGSGVDADRRLRRGAAGAPRPDRSAPPAMASGQEVDGAEDALADGAGAPADAERGRREQHDEGERELPVAREGSPPDRLLPTPTAQDGDSSSGSDPAWGHGVAARGVQADPRLLPTPTSSGTGNRDEKENRHLGHGPTLNDAAAELAELQPARLLPTPQAADGDGGHNERGAMTHAGVRPSGQKATLPLPTAVSMREELTETPFARPEDGQLVLLPTPTGYVGDRVEGQLPTEVAMLPTPVANPENPGAGGELRAAIVHGEGRRNETGIDTLGRPNEGRSKMLPTPTTGESKTGHGRRGGKAANGHQSGADLDAVAEQLLPTPAARDAKGPHTPDREGGASLGEAVLLPTATAADGDRTSEQFSRHYSEGADNPTLQGAAARAEVEWGVYGAAVRRWELVCGRPAPAPTDEKGRLAPAFVEWMLGYPAGWFDVEGVSRTRKLRALGNSVQVQCAEAVGGWLAFLVESGLLA